MSIYIGVDIGGTKCSITKGRGEQIDQKKVFDTTDVHSTLDAIFQAVAELGECEAIGVSCGGPLNEETGTIMNPPNLVDWDNIPVCRMLTDRFHVPAYLRNDANACALAEWRYGAGQNVRNMVFLTFGTGLGAGIILDGRLYSGTNGNAGECGHILLNEFGPVGYGKSGSFEGFCSGGGIRQLGIQFAREQIQRGVYPAYCPNGLVENEINAKTIADAAHAGDETALKVYRTCGSYLGRGLSVLIDILNPERIVIGSIFARSQDLLWESARESIEALALPQSAAVCRVVPAALGNRLGDVAALTVAEEGLKYDHNAISAGGQHE